MNSTNGAQLTSDSLPEYRHLFGQLSRGDEKAFTELFHEFTPKLLPFVGKLTRNDQVSRELIQETFLRLWIDREELKNINNPSAWIYRIASNLALDWLKTHGNRRRILKSLPESNNSDSLTDTLDSKELDRIIQKAVKLLPEKRQEVYRLSREEGLTHKQIAEKLNISQSTVKNLLNGAPVHPLRTY